MGRNLKLTSLALAFTIVLSGCGKSEEEKKSDRAKAAVSQINDTSNQREVLVNEMAGHGFELRSEKPLWKVKTYDLQVITKLKSLLDAYIAKSNTILASAGTKGVAFSSGSPGQVLSEIENAQYYSTYMSEQIDLLTSFKWPASDLKVFEAAEKNQVVDNLGNKEALASASRYWLAAYYYGSERFGFSPLKYNPKFDQIKIKRLTPAERELLKSTASQCLRATKYMSVNQALPISAQSSVKTEKEKVFQNNISALQALLNDLG